ncbi:MAG TPA: ankyrin repeat domain-containing protein, partial [Blastocatellia bacterium]|nr:ankyrin repeat domain-containing protein [Blastocatellia bacterium]
NGPAAHARRARAALRILTRYPEIARANIHTAVVCGDLEEVKRILKDRPDAGTEPGGPQRRRDLNSHEKLWKPLLHLCYGRLPLPAASANAEAIARVLLDHGADSNDFFEVGSHPCRYTALCGVAGEGEDDAPPHPHREALARLLVERGAEPYDIQVIYNIHFRGNVLWFLELMYEFSIKAGRHTDWSDPDWPMIGMGPYGSGARWHLDIAVKRNDLRLAEWALAHGASPNAGPARDSRLPQRTLYEEALRNEFSEMAGLLERYGATPSARVVLDGVEALTAACFRLDRQEALAQIAAHPEYLSSPAPMFAAARVDRADVVEFLLDLGMSIEVEDEHNQRPLHEAASHDSLRVAQLLIERGAEVEPVETNWNNTPLDHALYGNLTRMVDFLSSFSRDVYRLTWIGNIDRLREVQDEEPDFAKTAEDDNTPLMWLPEDEARAIEIVYLLVGGGADPKIRNKEGLTAADCAERRGLYEVADLLRSMERATL